MTLMTEFDKAQPIDIDEARPGDMICLSAMDEAKEVEKIMSEKSVGNPPRVWITWAGWSESSIYPTGQVVWVCMD